MGKEEEEEMEMGGLSRRVITWCLTLVVVVVV